MKMVPLNENLKIHLAGTDLALLDSFASLSYINTDFNWLIMTTKISSQTQLIENKWPVS